MLDRVLGGVCGGLGDYLALNAWWIRALFIILAFATFGVGVLIYLFLWLTLPEQTLADIMLAKTQRRTRPETLILIGGGVVITGVLVLALNLGVFAEFNLSVVLPFGIILVGLVLFAQQLRRLSS